MNQLPPKLQLLIWFWVGTFFGVLSGIANKDHATMSWFVMQYGVYGTLFFAAPFHQTLFRRLSTYLLAAGLVLSTALALIYIFNSPPSLSVSRVPIFENVNLLSAALAVMTAIVMLIDTKLSYRLPLVFIGFIGVFAAGSRLSLAAVTLFMILLAYSYVTMSTKPDSSQRRKATKIIWSMAFLLLTLFCVGVTYLELKRHAEQGNLIKFSNHFVGTTWRVNDATAVVLTPEASPGPVPGSHGTRVQFEGNGNSRLILHQGAGLSQTDQTYIGSLFVRADHPATIVLSTHLASTHCTVSTEWNRCITPASSGNGRINVQLRVEAVTEYADVDVYIWGAQLEFGRYASPLIETGTNIVLAKILMQTNHWWHVWDSNRVAAFKGAWSLFLQSPLGGVGRTDFGPRFADSLDTDGSTVRHAHNLVLQVLAESGIFGVIALLCPIIGLLTLTQPNTFRRQTINILLFIALLNSLDSTYFYAYVYVPVWSWFFSQLD